MGYGMKGSQSIKKYPKWRADHKLTTSRTQEDEARIASLRLDQARWQDLSQRNIFKRDSNALQL